MNSRTWMIGLLLILAVICSTALALVNIKTAPIIQKNLEITYMRTVLDVFGIGYDAENKDGIIETYRSAIEEKETGGLRVFFDKNGGNNAVSIEGSGFQGPISLVVAIKDGIITGFKVVSQVETPGLGARIMEPAFQQSFVGKNIVNGITMTKSGSAGPTEFDAITGATETSRALEKIINSGMKRYFEAVSEQ